MTKKLDDLEGQLEAVIEIEDYDEADILLQRSSSYLWYGLETSLPSGLSAGAQPRLDFST